MRKYLLRVKASRAAILELAWPASAVLVGYFWLHQSLTWSQALGGLVLTGAILMIARDTRDVESAPEKAPAKPKARPARPAAATSK